MASMKVVSSAWCLNDIIGLFFSTMTVSADLEKVGMLRCLAHSLSWRSVCSRFLSLSSIFWDVITKFLLPSSFIQSSFKEHGMESFCFILPNMIVKASFLPSHKR
ncbi:hypothetical protein GOP47_0030358 [Adiantum capillus-veneris]|nr:hypothetical protein GOP47_0030358 [Adiantum capillus-veneris]